MSHFSVAVFTRPNGKTVEELLDPYSEELEVAPYVARTEDEALKEADRQFKNSRKSPIANTWYDEREIECLEDD